MDKIPLLISRYLDGELADNEVAELAIALNSDLAAVNRLVLFGIIHAQLLTWMDHQSAGQIDEEASVLESSELLSVMGLSGTAPAGDGASKASPNRTSGFFAKARHRFYSLGALAAVLLIAASISVLAYMISSRPNYVGQLTDATGCRWATSPPDIQVGTFLQNGQNLTLIQGRAIITFATGAKLMLEGPVTLRITSQNEVLLIDGTVAAKVPRPAIGFAVKTSIARFVDWGTAFTVALRAEKTFELHVFEGLVELRLDERFGEKSRTPLYVAAVHAHRFNVGDPDVTPIAFEEGKQMPF